MSNETTCTVQEAKINERMRVVYRAVIETTKNQDDTPMTVRVNVRVKDKTPT